jgi:putative flippase GtrA
MAGRMLRFAAVGVVNTAIYYGLYLLLQTAVPYMAAHVAATFVAMACSYLMNCWLTFHVRPSWRTFALFPLSNATSFCITTITLPLAVEWMGVDQKLAPLLVGVLAIPATYVVAQLILTSGRTGGRGRVDGTSRLPVLEQTVRGNPLA